ncbi:MAG: methyltransferase domain-containing protein, partial [Nitrospinaceae bacterium]
GMIHHLQTHLTVSGETQFVVGNAETLSFPGVSLIGANAVFQWFRNPGGTLKRLRTCLDPGGYLVFSTFGPGTLREFRETGGFSGPASLHSLDGWKTLLTQADMEPVQALKEEKTLFFSGARELIRYLQQIGAAPLKIFQPGPLRRLLREYDSRYGAPEGILTRWELLFLAARTKSS